MSSKIYTTADAAKLLGRKPATLRAWRHRGIGPRYSQPIPGSTALYSEADLIEFKDSQLREEGR